MLTACCVAVLLTSPTGGDVAPFDERASGPKEWGVRPVDEVASRNPPPFSWRPQKGAASYVLEIASTADFERVVYAADAIPWNVHCATQTLARGTWWWRVRFFDDDENASGWSTPRRFRVDADAAAFPLPDRVEILRRVPKTHPRLFLRPEQVDGLRSRLAGGESLAALLARGETLLTESNRPTDRARIARALMSEF